MHQLRKILNVHKCERTSQKKIVFDWCFLILVYYPHILLSSALLRTIILAVNASQTIYHRAIVVACLSSRGVMARSLLWWTMDKRDSSRQWLSSLLSSLFTPLLSSSAPTCITPFPRLDILILGNSLVWGPQCHRTTVMFFRYCVWVLEFSGLCTMYPMGI